MIRPVLLWCLRFALLLAPAYQLYQLASGAGAGQPVEWWLDRAAFIGWVLCPYLLMFLVSLLYYPNWVQLLFMLLGVTAIMLFYHLPQVHLFFRDLPLIKAYLRLLPVIPTGFAIISGLFVWLFRDVYRPRH